MYNVLKKKNRGNKSIEINKLVQTETFQRPYI
jgi:hypothetical protein